jgi:hypothetical protein
MTRILHDGPNPKERIVVFDNPPPSCNFCGQPFGHTKVFYDYKTRIHGQWAYACEPCYEKTRFFPILGVGMGQKYLLKGAQWEKQ